MALGFVASRTLEAAMIFTDVASLLSLVTLAASAAAVRSVGAVLELHKTFIQITRENTGYDAEGHEEDLSRDHGPSPRHDP